MKKSILFGLLLALSVVVTGCEIEGKDGTIDKAASSEKSVDPNPSNTEPTWDDVRKGYVTVTDDLVKAMTGLQNNIGNWNEHCKEIAVIAEGGLDLEDTPSAKVNSEWDTAMRSLMTADDKDLPGCVSAVTVGGNHAAKATNALP